MIFNFEIFHIDFTEFTQFTQKYENILLKDFHFTIKFTLAYEHVENGECWVEHTSGNNNNNTRKGIIFVKTDFEWNEIYVRFVLQNENELTHMKNQ